MSQKRRRGEGTFSNKTDAEIDQWRMHKALEWGSKNISGYIVHNEGTNWIMLEGDDQDVDDAFHDLANDNFFDSFTTTVDTPISSKSINQVYTYDRDRSPLTDQMVDQCP